jgi:CBS domain-containing protein
MDAILKKTVKEFMTKRVIAVDEKEGIKALFKLMDKHGILGVPVVDKERNVVGIVTESDLLTHFTTLETPSSVNLLGGIVYLEDISDFNKHLKEHCAEAVKELMTKTVVTLNETATLQDAINTMAEKMINRLPVVDSKNKLVGIVTRTDIVHQLSQLKAV